MKKRIVSIIICLVMVFSAVASYGCSRTMANDQTEAPQNPTMTQGQEASETAEPAEKPTPDLSGKTIISYEDVADRVTVALDIAFQYNICDVMWISQGMEQDIIENPTLGNDVLFAVCLSLDLSDYAKREDETLTELEPLKEYLIRLGKALNDEGYALDWNIVDRGFYRAYFTGLLTAEQILIAPEKFQTIRFDFAFGRLNENNEVIVAGYIEDPIPEVVASSKDVTEAEIEAACSKSSPADYDRLPVPQSSPIPEIVDVPAVEYSLEGKRVLYASDLAGDAETGKGDNGYLITPIIPVDKRTREYLLADENSDATFAVQGYVYYGVGRTEAAARYHAMYTAKQYAEWGCPLNWAVVKVEGREGYYPFLYGYVTTEQIQNLEENYVGDIGYCYTRIALADVDANGNIVIDLMKGATVVETAK